MNASEKISFAWLSISKVNDPSTRNNSPAKKLIFKKIFHKFNTFKNNINNLIITLFIIEIFVIIDLL